MMFGTKMSGLVLGYIMAIIMAYLYVKEPYAIVLVNTQSFLFRFRVSWS